MKVIKQENSEGESLSPNKYPGFDSSYSSQSTHIKPIKSNRINTNLCDHLKAAIWHQFKFFSHPMQSQVYHMAIEKDGHALTTNKFQVSSVFLFFF